MPIRAIAYASEAIPGLCLDEIDDLTRSASRFNMDAGVTGVLLYDGARFLQYIEGPEDSINIVYSRILASAQHREVIELGRGFVSGRCFPYWSMRMLPALPDEVKGIATSDWAGFSRTGAVRCLTRVVVPHLGSAEPVIQIA